MVKLFLILLAITCNVLNIIKAEYDAPKTTQYPFGDEVFNADMKDERVHEDPREIQTEIIKNINTFCPNTTDDEEARLYEDIPYNDNECTKCDIRPTVDKTGVLVECYNCSDVSMMTTSQDDISPTHMLFLTAYLEIANYSLPEENI